RSESIERLQIIEDCMNIFDDMLERENAIIEQALVRKQVTDSQSGQLAQALDRWKANRGVWSLINGVATNA
ncbi:MAG TPA: hypothetical protein VFU48_07365, partial [Nitrospira sp.]|nr:hypothetical protein [Nitrospira sp.]